MASDAVLLDYYAKRAKEYEDIYEKPERQEDLRQLRQFFQKTLAGHHVLEVACGTGYWTQAAGETAQSLVATDLNDSVLEIARAKHYACPVSFRRIDAFNLATLPRTEFTAGFAAAWWSHLKRENIKSFLFEFHRALSPEALVVFMDNKFVPGSSTPISRKDNDGNTFQDRLLSNGHRYEVLKNFPDEQEVRAILATEVTDWQWMNLNYFWLLTYRIRP